MWWTQSSPQTTARLLGASGESRDADAFLPQATIPALRACGAAMNRAPAAVDVRWCRLLELRPCPRRMPWRQTAAGCTFDRSCAAAVDWGQREEGCQNGGTPTTNINAARMMALRIADRSVFALAPHRPPVFQSTYLGPPGTWIGQSNYRAAIIALKCDLCKALIFGNLRVSYLKKGAHCPIPGNFFLGLFTQMGSGDPLPKTRLTSKLVRAFLHSLEGRSPTVIQSIVH